MTWTSFPGSRLSSKFPRRLQRKLARGFSLLPTLMVLLSLSALACSAVALRRGEIRALTRERAAFEKGLEKENREIEEGWFNVAF